MVVERGIKEAFEKVKSDMTNLNNEVIYIKEQLNTIYNLIDQVSSKISLISLETNRKPTQTQIPTNQQTEPTNHPLPTHNPTVPQEIKGLKSQFLDTSTGNKGVPTDRQTNQQTDKIQQINLEKTQNLSKISLNTQIQDAQELLNSLDNIKKQVRFKFKTITNQEMLVFSTIYELEQSFPEGIEYEQIASKLRLSPSSIRDYVLKLISKGIPIIKDKLNNKKILLKISPDLKRIATLDTILKLREI